MKPPEGKSLAHGADKYSMAGDHSLQGAVKDLQADLKSGVSHEAVKDMKGLDRK